MTGLKIGTSWIGNEVYIYYPSMLTTTTTWVNNKEGILTVLNNNNECLAIFEIIKDEDQIFLLECVYCSNCKLITRNDSN